MKPTREMLARARDAEAGGRTEEALRLVERVIAEAKSLQLKFDALQHRARLEATSLRQLDRSLDTYWEARHLTRKHRLGRAGEADLGIGMTLLDLERTGEGLEAIRRAARYFRKAGNTYLRGCAETLLADEALKVDKLSLAERHLEVASDLLAAAGEPRMLSSALTLRAEVRARQGREDEAEGLLARAARIARELHDTSLETELQTRRGEVRAYIASYLLRGREEP